MRKPLEPNSPIGTRRYTNWVRRFGMFRTGVTRGSIEDWLDQFEKKHRDLAARVLDAVLFINQQQITTSFQTILSSLSGWHTDTARRSGRWFFVAMSGSAGESGDAMMHLFRIANRLDHRSHDCMFKQRSDLVMQRLTPEDTVVLLDDFSGSGNQICEAWEEAFSEMTAGAGKVYLILVAATHKAQNEIQDRTDLTLVSAQRLAENDDLFSSTCTYFTKSEKSTLLLYNQQADAARPKGYGNCGLLVVFQHKCPNNSLPILHKEANRWQGIFPAHD